MRRRSKVSTDAATGKIDNEQNFWPSYADMMSSFALILFFLMLLAYLSNIQTGNNLRNTEERLSDTLSKLAVTQAEYDEANASLMETQDELTHKEAELNEKEITLATLSAQLDELNAALESQKLVLTQQQAKIDAQAQYVSDAQVELEKMHGQMETIVGVRREILEQIVKSINAAGGSSRASIGDNGNIVLDNAVFFDTNSADLKPEGYAIVEQLVRVFTRFLSDPENSKYIDSITISGHTDSTGTDEINLDLSTARANTVLKYMLLNHPDIAEYSAYFCAAGYGSSRPIASNTTADGRAQNRRIEISITLKDDTVMDIVNEYLQIDVPDTSDPEIFIG
jgi:chemotaxis protein MotB